MTNKRNIFYISIILFISGVFFRFYQLNFEDYWLDEMVSFWIADPKISREMTLSRFEFIDYNAPLFNLILKKYFFYFGYDPNIGRQLPLIFGILSIPLLGILSYQVKRDHSFLLTLVLITINIYLIRYSQETRPYSLVFLLSIINLVFFYKITSSELNSFSKIYTFLLFIFFSVLSLSSHPFVFIIFFSQVLFSIYSYFIFKNKNFLFFLTIPFILLIYFFFNYDYLFEKFSHKEYYLDYENWHFYYNYYFSRFFGSKIMGLIFLVTLIILIISFRKKILIKSNNYLLLVMILFFSYLIPLLYGLLRTPILLDRYIIFVLIPILILIPSLIFEISNYKIKVFIILFLLLPAIANHYIEINHRLNSKPEFSNLLDSLNKSDVKNFSFYLPNLEDLSNIESKKTHLYAPTLHSLVENYIISLKQFNNNDFKMFDINNLPPNVKKLWIICYEPLVGYDCKIKNKKKWILSKVEKKYLVSAQLFEIKK